jgi:RNA polymerase sigma-70 factor (ECF subfamily)
MADPPTFDEIYGANRARVVRYLARLVGEAEAEDLGQEVFAKVSRALDGFEDRSNIVTWIYRIATNTALDRLRSPAFKAMEPVEDIELVALEAGPKGPTVEQQAIRQEMSACVRRMLDRLPGTYRTVILLSEVEGFKDREIADVLGVRLSAAKITLHRARERLRKVLSENCVFYRNEENVLACDRKRRNR